MPTKDQIAIAGTMVCALAVVAAVVAMVIAAPSATPSPRPGQIVYGDPIPDLTVMVDCLGVRDDEAIARAVVGALDLQQHMSPSSDAGAHSVIGAEVAVRLRGKGCHVDNLDMIWDQIVGRGKISVLFETSVMITTRFKSEEHSPGVWVGDKQVPPPSTFEQIQRAFDALVEEHK